MYHFIVNPYSRTGAGVEIWKTLKKELDIQNVPYQFSFTAQKGHASQIAAEIASQRSQITLVVVGGDGTLNEAINGLMKSNFSGITLGYIPTGSGNDFAKGIHLETDFSKLISIILNPSKIEPIDIGFAQTEKASRYFLISSGIGFDAATCYLASVSKIKILLNRLKLGKLTYVFIALKYLLQYKSVKADIRCDEQTIHLDRFLFSVGMNTKFEGGGCMFCPKAKYNDNFVDVCTVGNISKLKILTLLPTAFIGKHIIFKGVYPNRCKELEIHTEQPQHVHCDGESLGICRSLKITMNAAQIPVITE